MDRIPVIDIEPFLRGVPAGRVSVPAAIRETAEQIGFFAIDGHGVPRTTMDALYAKAHAFFGLPLDAKQRAAPPKYEPVLSGDFRDDKYAVTRTQKAA